MFWLLGYLKSFSFNFSLIESLCSFWHPEQMKCCFDVSPSPVLIIVPSSLSKNVVPISSLHSSHLFVMRGVD